MLQNVGDNMKNIKYITYPEARYLKHMGDEINVKVTIKVVDSFPVIFMRDFEFFNFKSAIYFLRHIMETEVVS